jgi:hypothetical protein
MNQLTKAQISVGLLAFFATMWGLIRQITPSSDLVIAFGRISILFVVLLVLSVVLLGILEWVKIFDLKTNSIFTLIVLITVGISSVL